MLILNGRAEIERGLTLPLTTELHDIIVARLHQLTVGEHDIVEMTLVAVFEAGDTDADLLAGAGISLLTNPLDGAIFPSPEYTPPVDYLHWATPNVCEAIVCIGNSGYGVHVLIPTTPEIKPDLLAWCQHYAA